ncbi:VanW family protein [Peribacillus saganii]|uniref:VanW family protein n=1 Tax=Peribacillus saganii TaxID=2303992 RepID=UPI001314ED87|nr:VanW family protein [Peribacillus saganii]
MYTSSEFNSVRTCREVGRLLKIPFLTGILLLSQLGFYSNELIILHKETEVNRVNRSDFTHPSPEIPTIHVEKYLEFLELMDKEMYQAPKNAYIDKSGHIIPGVAGHKLYREKFSDRFLRYYYGNGPSKLEVPLQPIHPKVDEELLAEIRVHKIGQFVSSFNSYNKNRTNNISLAAEALNNHVLFPQETFSFNKIVGKRTAARGYMKAKVIVRGEFSEGIGGGICQVSSTLFNAVDQAGLKIVERYCHTRQVPYVPFGRDATVSWNGPDFKFQNNINQPILILAKVVGGRVIINIFSAEGVNVSYK